MKTETFQLTTDLKVTLTTYLHEPSKALAKGSRPAVLICPGGGYLYISEREGEPIALAFMAAGYQAFVLSYSIGDHAAFPRPLLDAEIALRQIRSRADEWAVDPAKIAACGFSAGGHLAAALGTMGKERPNALILAYPCILENMSATLPEPIPSLEHAVDGQTPPAFIWATTSDQRVPVENSLEFAAALNRAGVPFELHVFQSGVHGLALANPVTAAGNSQYLDADAEKWFGLCLAWLANQWK